MIVSACCKSCGEQSDPELANGVLKMIRQYEPSTRVLDLHAPAERVQ
jgi:hypothetical protein